MSNVGMSCSWYNFENMEPHTLPHTFRFPSSCAYRSLSVSGESLPMRREGSTRTPPWSPSRG